MGPHPPALPPLRSRDLRPSPVGGAIELCFSPQGKGREGQCAIGEGADPPLAPRASPDIHHPPPMPFATLPASPLALA
jgi:hypothetical protein